MTPTHNTYTTRLTYYQYTNTYPTNIPTTPACTWWNRPEEDNSSGKLESTHPSRTSVKSVHGYFGVESVMRVNADSLLIRAAATSTLNDLTTDLIMANNNNNNQHLQLHASQIRQKAQHPTHPLYKLTIHPHTPSLKNKPHSTTSTTPLT